jgi:hypothetical protein
MDSFLASLGADIIDHEEGGKDRILGFLLVLLISELS